MSAADEEDARLNKMRILQDKKLDYAELTARILKSTGFQRSPDAAMKDKFLKSRSGVGAWGHESSLYQTSRSDYGKMGF